MEGYDGRERHEVFDRRRLVPARGDLVVVDDDGFLYFKGRSGDMIKTGGANVSPREVEAAILDVDRARRPRGRRRRRGPRPGRGRRASRSRPGATSTTDELRAQLAGRALRLQGAAPLPRLRRRRRPDDVERQARPAGRSKELLRCRR